LELPVSLFDVLRVLVVRRVSCFRPLLALLAFLGIVAGASPRLFAQVTQLPTWTEQSVTGGPPARYGAMVAYDAASGQVVLFGGFNFDLPGGYMADTWTWNGSTWTEQSPGSSPPAREFGVMAYDAATSQVVLFGGVGDGLLNDTWTWNGTTWTQQTPTTSPLARYGSTMAYDTASSQLILFGGLTSSSGDKNDTWTWSGSTWTELSPGTSPPVREEATMAYDAASSQVVLFGGFNGVDELNDTWTWNGTTWTEQSAAPSGLTVRDDAAMAYDAAISQVVLFGGNGPGSVALNDTWTWNGTMWTEQSAVPSGLTARDDAAMAYDAASSQVVLFGGNSAGAAQSNTWTLQMPVNLGTANVCPAGTTAPTPCSQSGTVSFNVAADTIIGSIHILTQGATGLDFQVTPNFLNESACQAQTYSSATTCTVDVTFAPTYAGPRNGAVVIEDGSGNVLATTYLSGTGTAPQVAFTPGTINTYAGNGTLGSSSAELHYPQGVTVDGAGNTYIADTDNDRIQKVAAFSGAITTVAGITNESGYGGDEGAATSAKLDEPQGVVVDGAGNLYIADFGNDRVREVNAVTGIITTVAGNGTGGYSGDGGAATIAELHYPMGVAVDGAGNLYIADYDNERVREVNAVTGIITTVAGNGTAGYSGDGGAATSAELNEPTSVAVDGEGNLFINDLRNRRIREMSAGTGIITTVAGDGTAGYSGDGGPATSAELYSPEGVAVDAAGDIYINDSSNGRIREVSAGTGIIMTIAGNGTTGYSGDGGAATSAELNSPVGVALMNFGGISYVLIPDVFNNVIRAVQVTTPATLTYATSTAIGSIDTEDGAQTVAVSNIGNASLTITGPVAYPANFPLNSSAENLCASSAPLLAGTSCAVSANFDPTASGSNTGSVTLTDNALNVTTSSVGSAQQSISLSGTGMQPGDNTGTQVSVSPNQVTAGQTVAIIAVVSDTTTPGTFPTGGVTFIDTVGSTTVSLNGGAAVTLSGGTATLPSVTLSGLGAHTITATYAGVSGSFLTSTNTGGVTVAAIVPTLTFGTIAAQTYGNAAFTVSATSASSGAVTYSVVSGPATIVGNTVTLTGAGVVVLSASQAASGNYAATTTPATTSFTAAPEVPTLTFGAIAAQTYGKTAFTVSATSASSGAVTYSVVSGPAKIVGNTVTLTGAGTVVLSASQAASGNYAATTTPATTSFTAAPEVPTLTFGVIAAQKYGNAAFAVSATSASSGAVTYSVVSGPATIVGNTVTLTGAGTVVLSASQAAAGGNYAAATGSTSFVVAAIAPALSLAPIAAQIYGNGPVAVGTSNSPAPITYAVVSGPATISGAALTLTGVGTVVVSASQVASGGYNAASVTTSFTVAVPFTISAGTASSSVSNPTVEPGGLLTYTITLTPRPLAKFIDAVTLSTSGLPTGATATFSPATVAAGSGTTTVTLTIQLPSQTASNKQPSSRRPLGPVAFGFLLLPLAGLKQVRRRLRQMPRLTALMLAMALSFGAVLGLSGCGSQSGFFSQAAQSYSVGITATDSTMGGQASTTVTFTVQ
jgi:hypothetical protein